LTIQEGPGSDRTERAKRFLRTLLRTGISVFEDEIGHVIREMDCACASYPVVEKKEYKRYEFGPNSCSECDRACGVEPFLAAREDKLVQILGRLRGLPNAKKIKEDGKKTELGKIEDFIAAFLASHASAREMNPCLTVGDLLIALESATVPDFYTINAKESQYLCRWFEQTLIVRKPFPGHEDIVCDKANPVWPIF
jgi:hypothetical protein